MKVLKSIFSKIFVLALILGVAISFAGCKKDTNKKPNNIIPGVKFSILLLSASILNY